MEYIKGTVAKLLVDHFENDYRRTTHALEVLKYAEMIIEKEENIDYDYETLITVALLHDVGIEPSELGKTSGSGLHM